MSILIKKNGNIFLTYTKFILGIWLPILTFLPESAFARQEVSIQIEGAIKPHCGFEQTQPTSAQPSSDVLFSIHSDDIYRPQQIGRIALALTCNAPFSLAVRSNNGGLVNQSSGTKTIGGAFANEIAYDVALTITTEDAASPLVLACPSRDMVSAHANCSASSGTNAAIGPGAGVGDVAVSLSGSSQFPIRGRYHDTIVLALAFQ